MQRKHRGLKWSLRAGLLAVFGASLDCATLDKIETNTCGNGVVDYQQGEDCDGFAIGGTPCRAKGQDNACHLDCSPGEAGTAGKCPTGWGCGVSDKVCHAPGDGYVVKNGFASAESAFKLLVGDYDGDGRKDILTAGRRGPTGTARSRVHFAGATGLSSVGIPSSIGPGTFSDLDGDGKDDIAFVNAGYGVLRGNTERALSPLALPISKTTQSVRLVPLYVRPEADASRTLRTLSGVVAFGAQAANVVMVSQGEGVPNAALDPIPMPAGAGPSAFHFLTGRVDAPLRLFPGEPTSLCGDAVAWVQGASEIRVYRTCNNSLDKTTLASSKPERVIDVPGLVSVAVGDYDGDGVDDIVAQVDASEGAKLMRSLRVLGAPSFVPRAVAYPAQEVGSLGAGGLDTNLDQTHRLLGFRDLNGDGHGDLIFGSIIALSTVVQADAGLADAGPSLTSYRTGYQRRTAPWREVATGDFDGDGRIDLIGSNASEEADAGSAGNSDLDVLLAPGFQYVPQVISTGAPASRLAVGDFDGDATDDLAFAVQNINGTSDLRVAFGKRNATPYDVVTVASDVSGLAQIVNQTTGRGGGITDDIHDIGFVAQTTEANQVVTRLYVALGGADRQPTTRILSDHVALGAVSGRLRTSVPELLSLGLKDTEVAGTRRTTRTLAGGSSLLDSAGVFERCGLGFPETAVDDRASFAFGLVPAAGDRDQVVFGLGRAGTDGILLSSLTLGATPTRNSDGICLTVPLNRNPLPTVPARLDDFSEIRGGDLDGDGQPDVIVLAGALSARRPGSSDPRDAGAPQVLEGTKVYALYGKGTAYENAVPLALGDAPGGMALLRGDDGKVLLATLTTKGVSIFRVGAGRVPTLLPITIEGDVTGISPAPEPSAIAGGDFDGDGLDDIAIVADGVLRVLFRKQCAEAACRRVAQ